MKNTLIIGGARSGKSSYAQNMALKAGGAVLFVATAEAGDEEMKRRIEAHRKARPPTWQTLEATIHLGRRIALNISKVNTVIIDCITLLVNNIFQQYNQPVNKEIEDLLFISYNTVKNHIYNIYQKLGVNSRGQMIHSVLQAQQKRENTSGKL